MQTFFLEKNLRQPSFVLKVSLAKKPILAEKRTHTMSRGCVHVISDNLFFVCKHGLFESRGTSASLCGALDTFCRASKLISLPLALNSKFQNLCPGLNFRDNFHLMWGILGSPRHSPHLEFIPLVHLDFFLFLAYPHLTQTAIHSPHLDFFFKFSIPSAHLDCHTLTSPRVFTSQSHLTQTFSLIQTRFEDQFRLSQVRTGLVR